MRAATVWEGRTASFLGDIFGRPKILRVVVVLVAIRTIVSRLVHERIKLYEISASDPTDYVKKSGDSMTGTLRIKPGSLKTLHLDSGENSNLNIRRNGADKLIIRDTDLKCSVPIFIEEKEPQHANHAASKSYVDKRAYGIAYRWVEWVDYDTTVKNLKNGEFTYDNGDSGGWAYLAEFAATGLNIFTNAKRDADFTGMLKAYNTSGYLRMALRFKNIMTAHYETDNTHVARYNIAIAYRYKDTYQQGGDVLYLKDGCWL